MKNTNKCPKCHSTDIKRVNGSIRGYGAGNNIMLGLTIFSAIKVNRYVCLNCGFCEEWIDENNLEELRNCSNPKG